jgi:hypothetical protein
MGSGQAGDARPVPRPARSLDAAKNGGDGAALPSARDVAAERRPTPAREGVPAQAGEPEPARPEAESITVSVDGVAWTVRVRGRTRAGTDTAPTPLLVLGFFRDATEEVPELEALVVARALDDLTTRQLERAFGVARPPPEPGAHKELFPETATRGRKGDR